MPLSVAVQMDHVSTVNIAGDTTFALSLEAQRRGHKLYHYTPDRLSLLGGKVFAGVEEMTLRDEKGNHFTLGEPVRTDLSEMDVVLLRQDPPFDMNYITTTHILERIHPNTLVVNDPGWVRNSPEKIFVTEFPDLMPETLITKDPQEVAAFRKAHGDVIIKPLYGNGGAGVFHLGDADRNLSSLLELFGQMFREPFIVQRYLKDVRKGDKRIILIDGEVAGAINRVPSDNESRSNMHVGGRAEKTELTEREREICARIGPSLKARGFILVGIDVIGDYMTEINVTSPTGVREVKRFGGADIAALFWDAVEAKRSTLTRARQTVADFLKRAGLKINQKLDLTGDVQRIPVGWVFHYNSSAFVRSGQISDSLVGQGPTIVLDDGRLLEGGSAETVSDVLHRYRVKSET